MTTLRSGCALLIPLLAPTLALAGPSLSVDLLSLRLDYGVFADGGSNAFPYQDSVSVSSSRAFLWEQTDGVASASASADVIFDTLDSPDGFSLSGSILTSASALVGDNPSYSGEHGSANAYISRLWLAVTLFEPHQLTLTGTVFSEIDAGLGTLAPGSYSLEPGTYFFRLPASSAFSSVSVGANEQDSAASRLDFGIFLAIPAPSSGAAGILASSCLLMRRRR